MEKPVSFVECQPASNEISNSIVTRMTFSDEDDDLEIVDTIDETLQTVYKQNKDDLNGETKDADDLRFELRKDEKRLRELFPHVRSINELDEKELQLAKGVINKEKLMLSKPTPSHPALSGQKRSAENSLLQDSKVQKVNESNKQPVIQSQLSHPETAKPPIKKNPLLGESKVIARPVNFTNNNNPAKVWQGRENMKYVNGSLINIDNLIQNAPKLPSQNKASISSNSMSSTSSTKMKESEKKLLDEIDLLLSKKSSHEQEANNEWFDNFQNRLQNLEKQEYKDKLRSERSFIIIHGFECINCNHFLTELYPSVCKDKGHVIRSTTLIKRFFLCRGCSRRDSTLSLEKNKTPSSSSTSASSTGKLQQPSSFCLPPNHNCAFCGKDDWVLAGKSSSTAVGGSGGGDGVQSLTGEKLVTSATDWTSRQDKLNMAVRVSNLDNK